MNRTEKTWLCVIICSLSIFGVFSEREFGEKEAEELLRNFNDEYRRAKSKVVGLELDLDKGETNTTGEDLSEAIFEECNIIRQSFLQIRKYPWYSYKDSEVRRQMKLLSTIGLLALSPDEYHKLKELRSYWKDVENDTTICDFFNKSDCNLHLNPDIKDKLKTSRNPEELSYIVKEWKRATGPKLEKLLAEYLKLCRRAAILNNMTNLEEHYLWNSELPNFDIANVKNEMESLWEKVKPLYMELHAYVRRRLRFIYGEKLLPKQGTIPSYLLGELSTGNWLGIADNILPYPDALKPNLKLLMMSKNYNSSVMHEKADDYFQSMNFSSLPHLWLECDSAHSYRNGGKNGLQVLDLGEKKGVRIRHCCTELPDEFFKALKLVTKAEYIALTEKQIHPYCDHYDTGLEKSFVDATMLSASTIKYLNELGLFDGNETHEMRINRLFKSAMEEITPIPLTLIQEIRRIDILGGKDLELDAKHARALSEKFQGLNTFTEDLNFDPGGMYDIFMSSPPIYNFVNYFLRYLIYDFLCTDPTKANKEDIDQCCLYGNVAAGSKMRNLMSLSSCKPLTEVLEYLTGQNKLSATSLLKYFEPLMKWLQEENIKSNETVGWVEFLNHEPDRPAKKSRRKRSLDMPIEYSSASSGIVKTFPETSKKIWKRDEPHEMVELSKEREDKNVHEKALEFALQNNPNEIAYASKVKRSASQGKDSGKEGWNVNFSKQDRSFDVQNFDDEFLADQFQDQNLKNVKKIDGIRSLWNTKNENNGQVQDQYDSFKGSPTEKKYKGRLMKRDSYEYVKRLSKKSYPDTPDILDYDANPYNLNINANRDVSKARYIKSIADTRRRHANGNPERGNVQKNNNVQERKDVRISREARWHSNNKKDISRLLHSFGFAVENEEKDKLKDMKKKLKGGSEGNGENNESDEGKLRTGYEIEWSNADLKKKAFNQKKERTAGEQAAAMAAVNANRMNGLNSMAIMSGMPGVNPFNNVNRMNSFSDTNALYNANSMSNSNSVNDLMNMNKMNHYDTIAQNSEQKSNVMSKYGNNIYANIQGDYGHLSSADGGTYGLAEPKKTLTVENMMSDNREKNERYGGMKDSYDASHLNSALTAEEKAIGKKEVVSNQQNQFKEKSIDSSSSTVTRNADSNVENVNIDVPSIQILLKNPNLKGYSQSGIGSENLHGKLKTDSNQIYQMNKDHKGKLIGGFNKEGKIMNHMNDIMQLKDTDDYREISHHNYKTPFVIILGQITPEMKEHLTQSKSYMQSLLKESEKSQHLPDEAEQNMKKFDGKRNGMSEKIYVIPIEIKDNQYVPKSIHYIEPNSVGDMNAEKDHETEEKLVRVAGNSKLKDKSGFFKGGKDNPADFVVAWDEKTKSLLKRSKRELKYDSNSPLSGLKVIQITPMMESELEGLLGKSLDQVSIRDKNPKMSIRDGSFDGENEMSPLSSGVPSIYMLPESNIGAKSMSLPSFASPSLSPSAESQSSRSMMIGSSSMDGSSSVNSQGSAGSSSSFSNQLSTVLSALAPKTAAQAKAFTQPRQELEEETEESKLDGGSNNDNLGPNKDQKDQDLTLMGNPNLRCSTCAGKKKPGSKNSPEEEQGKRPGECDSNSKGDDSCCKKLILTPSPPKCPSPPPCVPCPSPSPPPCPCPCPPPCGSCICPCPCPLPTPPPTPPSCGPSPPPCPPPPPCSDPCCEPCCRKPSECSLVNCQFKITKAKKPHERLTIMIYDRINPPADMPEPYDALAVISEVLQRIQCSNPKPCTQLTEEDPDYPANDNTDQLKSPSQNQASDIGEGKSEEVSGELPIFRSETSEEEEDDDGSQANAEENKIQPREKSTPAIDQLTVFNKDKLKPVLMELRKIDNLVKNWRE